MAVIEKLTRDLYLAFVKSAEAGMDVLAFPPE